MKHTALVLALGFVAAGTAFAQSHDSHHAADSSVAAAGAASGLTDAVVQKVDKAAGKITLKHGPIRNLDMPPMTMVFRVKDAAMLDPLKPGQKVRFAAEDASGALTVTAIEPVK